MANGWARDGAVQEQIETTVADEVARVRDELRAGESREHCEECGAEIPGARRDAMPGVRFCVACQSERDKHRSGHNLYNRRGSKDSQLR